VFASGEGTKPCPRCGTEFFSAEYAARLAAEIPIAAALRSDEQTRERRLSVCSSCDMLRESVLCACCGCFVQFRSRIRSSHCPHPAGDFWLETRSGKSIRTH
jgi:hypothetical protein